MGFTTPCFIRKSTKELTDKIYRLRGRSGINFWHSEYLTLLLAEEEEFTCLDDDFGNANRLIDRGYIDCGENEELFIALSALRYDTDYKQWFTDGKDWFLCQYLKVGMHYQDKPEILFDKWHKASVNELIEHFKQE